MELVRITWKDAYVVSTSDTQDIKEYQPWVVREVIGYLVHSTEEAFWVSGDRTYNTPLSDEGFTEWEHITCVHKGMVEHVEVLESQEYPEDD